MPQAESVSTTTPPAFDPFALGGHSQQDPVLIHADEYERLMKIAGDARNAADLAFFALDLAPGLRAACCGNDELQLQLPCRDLVLRAMAAELNENTSFDAMLTTPATTLDGLLFQLRVLRLHIASDDTEPMFDAVIRGVCNVTGEEIPDGLDNWPSAPKPKHTVVYPKTGRRMVYHEEPDLSGEARSRADSWEHYRAQAIATGALRVIEPTEN